MISISIYGRQERDVGIISRKNKRIQRTSRFASYRYSSSFSKGASSKKETSRFGKARGNEYDTFRSKALLPNEDLFALKTRRRRREEHNIHDHPRRASNDRSIDPSLSFFLRSVRILRTRMRITCGIASFIQCCFYDIIFEPTRVANPGATSFERTSKGYTFVRKKRRYGSRIHRVLPT